jgi:uncharacterized protein involved in exopolysaccharide biosynthesis
MVGKDVSLSDLLYGMLRRAPWIAAAGVIAAIATFFWSKQQIKQYRADVQLVYVAPPDSQGSAPTGGVLSFLSGGERGSDKAIALASLNSRAVLTEYVRLNSMEPLLLPKLYDRAAERWKVAAADVPTAGDAAGVMRSKALVVKEDERNGTITITLDLPDPTLVASHADGLVAFVDRKLRLRASAESRDKLAYLSSQLASAQNADLKASIARLIETELRRQALARTGSSYAFSVIDPAVVPRTQIWPRPMMFTVVAGALMTLMACMISAIVDLLRSDKAERA